MFLLFKREARMEFLHWLLRDDMDGPILRYYAIDGKFYPNILLEEVGQHRGISFFQVNLNNSPKLLIWGVIEST